MFRASYKVPGGKLIKVQVAVAEGKITHVQFTGDFFLHPEDSLAKIESALIGSDVDVNKLTATIQSSLTENSVQMIGCSAEDFAHVIAKAVREFVD